MSYILVLSLLLYLADLKKKKLIYCYSPAHFQTPSQFSLDPYNTVRNGEMLCKETGSVSSQQRGVLEPRFR